VPRVVAIFGVQGWRWTWARAGRALARTAALRGKRVAVLPREAHGGEKDASVAWGAGVLTIEAWSTDVAPDHEASTRLADLQEAWEERTAIMVYNGHLPHSEGRIGNSNGLFP
jgi:hypothetical protein